MEGLTKSLQAINFGQKGFDVILSADGEQTGSWNAIKAVGNDASVKADVSTGEAYSSTGVYASGSAVEIPQADSVYGNFTKITVGSGTVLAYRK
jgi:hypothetical protein